MQPKRGLTVNYKNKLETKRDLKINIHATDKSGKREFIKQPV